MKMLIESLSCVLSDYRNIIIGIVQTGSIFMLANKISEFFPRHRLSDQSKLSWIQKGV